MTSKPSDLPAISFLLWESLGVPAWGIGPDQTIRFVNKRAEKLLGVRAEACVGRPCHEIITGVDADEAPVCCRDCPVFATMRKGGELEPETMQVPGPDKKGHWIQVLPIVLAGPDGSGPYVVESAVDVDRWTRIEGYIKKIAARELPQFVGGGQPLTPRESQVLSLLAEDLGLSQIASRLHVSYTTVRTHVRHTLAKMGVRSIQEAIARHLLEESAEA
jgi:PAS domain S-box-containing protein